MEGENIGTMSIFWDTVIDKGRLGEWLLTTGVIFICIIGGIKGFLEGALISGIIMALIGAVWGIEARKTNGAG